MPDSINHQAVTATAVTSANSSSRASRVAIHASAIGTRSNRNQRIAAAIAHGAVRRAAAATRSREMDTTFDSAIPRSSGRIRSAAEVGLRRPLDAPLDPGVDLVGRIAKNGLGGPEDVEGVDEAVHTHRLGAAESELDDLGDREHLAELPVELGIDRMVVGRQEVEELDGHSLLVGQVAGIDVEQAR